MSHPDDATMSTSPTTTPFLLQNWHKLYGKHHRVKTNMQSQQKKAFFFLSSTFLAAHRHYLIFCILGQDYFYLYLLIFQSLYLGYSSSILFAFIYPKGRPTNICRFRNSSLTNSNIGHFNVIFKDTGDFVVTILILIKRMDTFCTQCSCERSTKPHLNGVLALPKNPFSARLHPTLYWQFLISFSFHPAVKVINNLSHLTEISSVQ